MILLLRTQGGFCNRVRALVSGLLWAEDLGVKVGVYWPLEPGIMPCRFQDIFEESSIPELCCIHEAYLPKAHSVQSIEDMEATLAVFGKFDEVRIESYSDFHPESHTARGLRMLRMLRVVDSLEKRADAIWKELGGHSSWAGLHFRGTDSMTVGLEPFVNLIQENPRQHFFLATDEEKVKQGFWNSMFADRVHSVKCHQGRGTREEQLDGILEWLLLQKTSRIYGSVKSSFSKVAALRAGVEYEPISSVVASLAIS